jgi:hypothetical protein
MHLAGLRCSSRFGGRNVYLCFLVEADPLLTTAFYLDGVAVENGERF